MKHNLKKGFTILEVLIVIAITGVLAGTVAPKLIKEVRKGRVAKVQHNLGVIRSRLSLDESLLDEFPNLYDKSNPDLLKAYSIETTPSFTDKEGVSHKVNSEVTYSRTNVGGWIYNRDEGEIYANLPDGAYTKDEEYEIWGGETPAISKLTYSGSDTLSYGKLQFKNEDGEWKDIVDGEVYSSDTEIRYLPDLDDVSGNANQINIGTANGDEAKLSDWGNVNGDEAVLQLEDGTIITTTVANGNLKEFNGPGAQGNGIGSTNLSSGLNKNNSLKIAVDGEDINKVIFTLDGLGAWFDESSRNATQVNITAYNVNGEAMATQSSYRDSGSYSDEYSFEITEPVSYFELTSGAVKNGATGNGTYVVQNVRLIKSAQDYVNLTITHPDGTTEEISKDILLDNTNSSDPITINKKEEENE